MTPALRVFSGLLLGAISGLLLAHFAPDAAGTVAAVARPIGKLWLSALQMTIVPLVISLLIVGVNAASDAASSGRVARRAMLWIAGILIAAGAYAALVAPLLLSLMPMDLDLAATLRAASAVQAPSGGLAAWIGGIVPTNAIDAAAKGAIVPLVVFTLCFAFALTRINAARRVRIVEFSQAIADTMIVIVHWVLLLGPMGVFALILPVSAEAGAGVLGALGAYILMQCLMYIGFTLILYAVACIGNGEHLRRFAVAILPAQTVAASTQSSLASLPAMVEVSNQTLGYPTRVTALVLPMAVSLFRIASPIQYLGVVTFIAWSFGIEVGYAHLLGAVLLSAVISIGSSGLPGQAIFMGTNLPVVQSVGLPIEPLAMLLAVDLIPDIFATVGNVTGQLTVTSRVARAEPGDADAPESLPSLVGAVQPPSTV